MRFSRGTFLWKSSLRSGFRLASQTQPKRLNLQIHSVLFTIQDTGGLMRAALIAQLFSMFALPLFAQGAPPQATADQPYTVEYYYKVQWGHQQEFLQLFLKNHYPLLKKIVETGRMISIKIETPANHMTEDARWDYRVTIKFKNSTVATTANPDEEALIKQLWPDQETFKREEQRRFEILEAHWDLPVTDITPKK